MREFLTNLAVRYWYPGWGEKTASSNYHPEYLYDVVMGMGKARGYLRVELTFDATDKINECHLALLVKRRPHMYALDRYASDVQGCGGETSGMFMKDMRMKN
jgi:hypothetical protein